MIKPKRNFRYNLILLLAFLVTFTTLLKLSQVQVLPRVLNTPLVNVSFTPNNNSSNNLTAPLKKVFKQTQPATLQIKVLSANAFAAFVQGMGTGFFISPDGLVLTAYHVVERSENKKLIAFSADGESYRLEMISFDAYLDLALLQANVGGKEVPYLDLDVNAPRAGDKVLSIGNSGGNFLAGRQGHITRLNVSASRADFAPNTIEFDSKLAPGDSGGPVINDKGKVIGVVSYISYIPQDIVERSERFVPEALREIFQPIFPKPYAAYAVPILKESKIINSLLAGFERDVPVIGIYGANYNPRTFPEDLGPLTGALVDRVSNSGPAAKAGLKSCQLGLRQIIVNKTGCLAYLPSQRHSLEGYTINNADVIIAINGKRTKTFSDLLSSVRSHQIGEIITLTVQRGSELVEIKLTLSAQAEVF